jgi:rod shape-determining protein MreC
MTYDTASVIGSSGSNWSSSFTLNKGSVNSDIAIGDAVITEKGVLVGRVTMVDVTSSTAVSLIDTTFSAGALIGENGESGIATGDFELMRSGMLKLEYLPDDTAALAGDAVVTGGKNDILPEGLVIGTVRRVARNTTGVGMYAEIEPGADLTHLSNVFIITEFTTSS